MSDYSFGDARELLSPKPLVPTPATDDMSNWASIPLAFALLPAVGGLFFNNGSALVTDAMLLGLSAIFLHWSVTNPWYVWRLRSCFAGDRTHPSADTVA